MRPGPALAILALATGCNRYDLFRVGGYQQTAFSNKADILFVIDNSDSMIEEAQSLTENFGSFIAKLQEREATFSYDGLTDAVGNYQDYVVDRGAFVDYQFGITTTDISEANGALLGDVAIVKKGSPSLIEDFSANLLCNAFCAPTADAVDPDQAAYLDDVCGGNDWVGNCGSAGEQGLEAVYKAMCRSVPNPPTDCFLGGPTADSDEYEPLSDADVLSNEGFLRTGSTFIPVIVSDEGDGSVRLPNADPIPVPYEALYNVFGWRQSFVAIAPTLTPDYEVLCPGTAANWGVIRYKYFVEQTNGLFIPIDDGVIDGTGTEIGCGTADFGAALEQLGDLLQNLFNAFPLQSVPKEETILVFVDGAQVSESADVTVDNYGITRYSDGWTYEPNENSIVFHGAAVPGFDAEVQVYYEPIDGMPRALPF